MGFGDFLTQNITPIINTGVSAAQAVQRVTGTQPMQFQTCSYPDGSRLQWPINTPCPQTNPQSGSTLTSTETLGLIALLVGGIILLILVLK